MVVEVSKDPINKKMHYEKAYLVGVIDDVPDVINKRTYYSRAESVQMFNDIHNDVYIRTKNAPEPKKGGIPNVLKILGGVGLVASLALWGKSIGKSLVKFIKNFSK